MKKKLYTLMLSGFLVACGSGESTDNNHDHEADSTATEIADTEENAEEEEAPKPLKSPRRQALGTVADVSVDIDYGSPYVKERVIWGELVPYDKIWRAGANETTAITFGSDVMVEGHAVPAGTYALFIIPKENADWTIVLNEEWSKEVHGVWGAYDHKPEKDVLRFDVTPEFGEEVVESLAYEVVENGVKFAWENASFNIGIEAAQH